MPQPSTLRAYSREVSIAHKRRLIGTHRAVPHRPAASDTESDDMKVDSPSNDMDSKALVFDEEAIGSDDDDRDDDDEPPYKRICRGKESALSLAMRDVSKSR